MVNIPSLSKNVRVVIEWMKKVLKCVRDTVFFLKGDIKAISEPQSIQSRLILLESFGLDRARAVLAKQGNLTNILLGTIHGLLKNDYISLQSFLRQSHNDWSGNKHKMIQGIEYSPEESRRLFNFLQKLFKKPENKN